MTFYFVYIFAIIAATKIKRIWNGKRKESHASNESENCFFFFGFDDIFSNVKHILRQHKNLKN